MNSSENNARLTNWLAGRAKERFSRSVAIVAVYGSFVNGTAGERSDLDCFFVPKTDAGEGFRANFILNDIGYDVYPISWSRLARMAALEDMLLPCLGDSRVVYADTSADEAAFLALRGQMLKNLSDSSVCDSAAAGRLATAGEIFSLPYTRLSDARVASCYIAQFCAEAAALHFGDYFHRGLKTQYSDLCRIPGVPHEIPECYATVSRARSCGELESLCRRLLGGTARLLGCDVPQPKHEKSPEPAPASTDIPALARLYEEIVSTFNKVYHCAERGDYMLAFISACGLQLTLDEEIRALGGPSCDLMDAYDPDDLSPLRERVSHAQRELEDFILSSGGSLRRYDSFEQFEAAGL